MTLALGSGQVYHPARTGTGRPPVIRRAAGMQIFGSF